MKPTIILVLILLFGLLVRTIFINSSPLSLYGDELTIALDTYSLLKTGHDQLGNLFPLTFPMGAGRPAGYVYASIPFIAVFGPTALGVRALSILSGIGIILLLYYIGRRLFSQKTGLLASLITAVSIWDISLSRGGFEAHFALLLMLLGFYLFLKAKEKPALYIFSAISFGLTLHTYPTYKVSLLLFLPLLFWFSEIKVKDIGKKYILSFLSIIIILGGLSLTQTFVGGSETRFSSINIFSQEKLKTTIETKINFERSISNVPNNLVKYFHNKPVEYIKVIGENYLQNFSSDFLFIHGDRNPRHNMATMGQLYFAEIILIPLGLLSFWSRQRRALVFLLAWLVLAPVATAVVDFPHALRSALMLPVFILLSSLGLTTLISQKNKIPSIIIGLLFIIQMIFFLQKILFLAPREYGKFWSFPAKLTSDIAIQNKNEYDQIFISDKIDSLEFAYPVYAKVEPHIVIAQNNSKNKLEQYLLRKFDNVYISSIPENDLEVFLNNKKGKTFYIGTIEEAKYLKDYETIRGSDNLDALVLSKREN